MDAHAFDSLTRTLTGTRRSLLGGIAAAAAGWLGTPAAHAQRRRKKRPRFNEFGCLNVGQACRGDDRLCCSGICEGGRPRKGEKDRSRCRGHDGQDCQVGLDSCGVEVTCTTSAGTEGYCFTTTGNAAYCGEGGNCLACSKDADCVPNYGAGAACVRCPSCQQNGDPETACIALTL